MPEENDRYRQLFGTEDQGPEMEGVLDLPPVPETVPMGPPLPAAAAELREYLDQQIEQLTAEPMVEENLPPLPDFGGNNE